MQQTGFQSPDRQSTSFSLYRTARPLARLFNDNSTRTATTVINYECTTTMVTTTKRQQWRANNDYKDSDSDWTNELAPVPDMKRRSCGRMVTWSIWYCGTGDLCATDVSAKRTVYYTRFFRSTHTQRHAQLTNLRNVFFLRTIRQRQWWTEVPG